MRDDYPPKFFVVGLIFLGLLAFMFSLYFLGGAPPLPE